MIQLYNHQKVALAYLRMNDGFMLHLDPGTGKTIVTLCRVLDLLKNGKAKNALVVGPKSALGAWERDIAKFEPEEQERLTKAITLVNYEKIWRQGDSSPYNITWDIIICDEAHAIKNRTSKQAGFVLKLATRSKYRFTLTATPWSNGKLEDIWSQIAFIAPYIERGRVYSQIMKDRGIGGSYYNFIDRFCILNKYHRPQTYIRINELQDIINEYSFRVKKEDCLDLPEKLPDEIIDVELKQKALYKKLHKDSALLEYEILAENPLSRMVKLRQFASGHIKNEQELIPIEHEKIKTLQEIIERYDENKKLVIFAEFHYSITQISELLQDLKIKHEILDGHQKDKTCWRRFQSDPTIRIMVVQYKSGNAGIDLFASDTIIYYEPTIKSDYLIQSRDRIHRHGQTRACSYVHLITKGTIEEAIYKSLSNYRDFDEKVFNEYMSSFRKGFTK